MIQYFANQNAHV